MRLEIAPPCIHQLPWRRNLGAPCSCPCVQIRHTCQCPSQLTLLISTSSECSYLIRIFPVGAIFPVVSGVLELLAMFGSKLFERIVCLGLRNGAVKVADLGVCDVYEEGSHGRGGWPLYAFHPTLPRECETCAQPCDRGTNPLQTILFRLSVLPAVISPPAVTPQTFPVSDHCSPIPLKSAADRQAAYHGLRLAPNTVSPKSEAGNPTFQARRAMLSSATAQASRLLGFVQWHTGLAPVATCRFSLSLQSTVGR